MAAKQARVTSAGSRLSTSSTGKAKNSAKKSVKKITTREKAYREVFFAPTTFIGPDEFMPQVHGYGTPTYSDVGSFAGV